MKKGGIHTNAEKSRAIDILAEVKKGAIRAVQPYYTILLPKPFTVALTV